MLVCLKETHTKMCMLKCVCGITYVCMLYAKMHVWNYVRMYVGLSKGNTYKNVYAKMRVWNYVTQTRACSKSFWGG